MPETLLSGLAFSAINFPKNPIPHLKIWCCKTVSGFCPYPQRKDLSPCVGYMMGNKCLWPQWRFFGFGRNLEGVMWLNGVRFCCLRVENSSSAKPSQKQLMLWPRSGASGSAWRHLEKIAWALAAPEIPPMVGDVAREGGHSAPSPAYAYPLPSPLHWSHNSGPRLPPVKDAQLSFWWTKKSGFFRP